MFTNYFVWFAVTPAAPRGLPYSFGVALTEAEARERITRFVRGEFTLRPGVW